MYLCRIKNPEQLKHISPGEFGKLLGLDRVAETKKLREKIGEIVDQRQAEKWNKELAQDWIKEEETNIFYIDGHVKVYSGNKANLGKKHISRLKLCLPGMMEFWVNNSEGMPYFVVTGEVNEKMQEMILSQILPKLLDEVSIPAAEESLAKDPDLPRFTLVFDREAYSPDFFDKLWKDYRVAVITYRKNVKDKWDETDFTTHKMDVESNDVEMDLAEKQVELNDVQLREIRKKSDNGHQTSIVTTNKKLSLLIIAVAMFARWAQENFFKYLRQEYDLDRIVYYVVNNIDSDFRVVNPMYSKLTNRLKKLREKISRRQARLYQLIYENLSDSPDKTGKNFKKQSELKEELQQLEAKEKELIQERKKHSYKIKIKDMEEKIRYNKLDVESKLFQNIIKMICYRAETSFSILLSSNYKKKTNEMRALAKSLIRTKADVIPDYINNTLTIALYSLARPRDNKAAEQMCKILNQTQTVFPGTNLRLLYKIATV